MTKYIVAAALLFTATLSPAAEYWPALMVNPTNGVITSPVSNLTFSGTINTTIPGLASTTPGAEGIRLVGALGGYTLEGYLEDNMARGLARDRVDITVSGTNDLLVTWVTGDIYEPTLGYYHLNPGSKLLTDNAVNYAYWSTNNVLQVQWTTGTRPAAEGNIYIATFVTSFGRIIQQGDGMAVGDSILSEDVAFASVMPSLITEGLTVSPTGTDLTNILQSSGTEYHNLADRISHSGINFNTTQSLTLYTHTNSMWAKLTTNLFPVGSWDNGTDLVACNATKWYRGVFVSIAGSGSLQYVMPDQEFDDEAAALAGSDPDLPPGFTPYIPLSTAYVYKGDDVALRNVAANWLDRRFMIRRGTLATGGGANTPTLAQVLAAGAGTGGILPTGMGLPVTPDQAASKEYVDTTINNINSQKAYVDPNGNDLTAKIESSILPYKTIKAAIDASALVATDNRRFSVVLSPAIYTEDVVMSNYVSLVGSDIAATRINGSVRFPHEYTDVRGSEISLISVVASNAPALFLDAGADKAYMGARSCAFTSAYDNGQTNKTVVLIHRGVGELYGTCFVELTLDPISALPDIRNAQVFEHTTDLTNPGLSEFTSFNSSVLITSGDLDDDIALMYTHDNTDAACINTIVGTVANVFLNTKTNSYSNIYKQVNHNRAMGRSLSLGTVTRLYLGYTNNVNAMFGYAANGTADNVAIIRGNHIRMSEGSTSNIWLGAAVTSSDSLRVYDSVYIQNYSPALFPGLYTANGSAGKFFVNTVAENGDHQFGGAVDLANLNSTVPSTPQVGHVRLYMNSYAGLEQLYTIDSTGNIIRIGRDSVFNGYNEDGTTFPVGTPVYRKLGRSPQATPVVGKCYASNPATMPCVGIVVQPGGITNGGVGRVMFYGRTESYFNTSFATNGAALYVGEGALTNVVPTAPSIKQQMGSVHTSSTNGWMSVHTGEADQLSPLVVAWASSMSNTVNAATLGGLTKEQLAAQQLTYYVWGSLPGPYTNPVSRLAKLASPAGELVRTNTYVNCTNGLFLGGISVSTNESPRQLNSGLARLHVNLSTTATNDCIFRGTLYIYESDQTTLVQKFDGELVHIIEPHDVVHAYDLNISVTNDVVISDFGRIMLFRSELVSGWDGESISALSQDGYLTRILLPGGAEGVYASVTELDAEISARIAGDSGLSATLVSATNQIAALETSSTNQQAQITSAAARVSGIEGRTQVWNTASIPSTKFLANIGTVANQTFNNTTAAILYTNLVFNYGGTYSNSATVARWIPGASNVLVKIIGSLRINTANQSVLFSIRLYKNGSPYSYVMTKYSTSNSDDWAQNFSYVDLTGSVNDYYELFVTSDKAAQTTLGAGNDNWWSGEVLR